MTLPVVVPLFSCNAMENSRTISTDKTAARRRPYDRAARRHYRPVFRAFTSPLDLPDEMQEACQFYCSAQNSMKTVPWNEYPLLWADFPQGENSNKNRQQEI
ncbi:hypothetical protein [Agrobacterium fabrum]|uniref:hypothetical protein n=1 Tax=Agrobacterium fabrum TaxID=1176649 RepID=UPI003BA154B2